MSVYVVLCVPVGVCMLVDVHTHAHDNKFVDRRLNSDPREDCEIAETVLGNCHVEFGGNLVRTIHLPNRGVIRFLEGLLAVYFARFVNHVDWLKVFFGSSFYLAQVVSLAQLPRGGCLA